jgi:hypothetical protein
MTPEQKIIGQLEALLNQILPEYKKLKDSLPTNDIRPSFYSLPGNTLVSLTFQMHAFDSTICETVWWQAKFNKPTPSPVDLEAIQSLEKFSKHAFLLFYLSRIETNLKKTINVISPGFDPRNNKSFYAVYCEALNKLGLAHYIPLFDIARHTRNTIHSNGFYISNSGSDIQLIWKTKIYDFKHLKEIEFATFDEIIFLFNELFVAIKNITQNPIITSPLFIEDKFH